MPFAGAVTRQRTFNRGISGVITFSGAIGDNASLKRAIGGVLSFAGNILSFHTLRSMDGVLTFSGAVTKIKNGLGGVRYRGLMRLGFSTRMS